MRDFREEYRQVHSFHCNFTSNVEPENDVEHRCIFKLIDDMLDEIELLRCASA